MSTLSFLFVQQPSHLARFGLWTGYFFSINVVIGSGFLTLPYSFNNSGWVLGLILMVVFALQSFYLGAMLIEVISRVECIKRLEEAEIKVPTPSFRQILRGVHKSVDWPDEACPDITDRRFDLSSIIAIIYGQKTGYAFMVLLYLFMAGTQISYISIFASSFASTIPLGFKDACNIYEDSETFGDCRVNYWIFLCIYVSLMTWLTLKGLKEQRWLQTTLTFMRFVIIFLILITCIVLIATTSSVKNADHVPFKMPQPVNFSAMIGSLPNICFAFVYHMQFPSIIEFIKDKVVNLRKIIILVGITSFVVYVLLAIVVPIAIHDVKPQCSIEYANYSAGHSQDNRPWWTYIIAYIVVLFPAFDVFSSFPVMAVAVADNLQTLREGVSNEDFQDVRKQRMYRIFAVAVPACFSFVLFNLNEIIENVGLLAFFLVPVILPIVHVYTREMVPIHSKFNVPYYNKVTNI
jgi:amino acid permease